MKKIFYTILLAVICLSQTIRAQVTKQRVNPVHHNSAEQAKKPYLILISADGFRYDYAEKYKAENLLKLASEGAKASSMIPVFPASTLANHNSLITGLYPVHHGIIGNVFYDSKRKAMFRGDETSWFIKDPIWISAEKQGMVTAAMNFISSGPIINGFQTSYYFPYVKGKHPAMADRVAVVREWLSLPEDVRPHFIAIYANEADHEGHRYGPDSKQAAAAVHQIDSLIGQLQVVIKESGLPVNMVFTSDHGMTSVDAKNYLTIPASIDTAKFVVVDQGAHVSLHAKSETNVMPLYNSLKAANSPDYLVYLKKDLPKDLHFDIKEDEFGRIADILLLSKWPKVFTKGKPAGSHGFNPYEVKDVHASFYAWGPSIKPNVTLKPFSTLEVYGMMMQILGLKPEKNDGTGFLNKAVLK